MQLHQLKAPKGAGKSKRIVGRGRGSGRGKTSGRGENGQRSRTGRWCAKASEGGQMRLIRRLPKVGFRSHRPVLNQIVNLESLNKFDKGDVVNIETLKAKGLISSARKPVKILAKGDITKALNVQVESISKSAQEQIIKAGGTVEEIKTVSNSRIRKNFIDNIMLVDGIGPKVEEALKEVGITKISQLLDLSANDIATLEEKIGKAGVVAKEEWVKQAKEMIGGNLPRAQVDQDLLAKLKKEAKSKK